jgi:hypothetical protein
VSDDDTSVPAVREPAAVAKWRGDDHNLQLEAAAQVGLPIDEAALDSFTRGFSSGITIDDPLDGAIVARGRTPLAAGELAKSLRPAMRYLGVAPDQIAVQVHDGRFELRIGKRAAEQTKPMRDAGKLTLQVWIGFALLGFAAGRFMPQFVSAIIWGVGLLLGAWQLRRGLASGRAVLAARVALALGMLAQAEQLVLPPAEHGVG